MKFIRINLIILFLLCSGNLFPNMILETDFYRVKIFQTQTDISGWNALIKGKVISYSLSEKLEKDDLQGGLQDNTKATVRLYNKEGIKEGDILYVINEKNLIIARMKVAMIFKSKSLGYLLIGYGNFKFGSNGDRVVLKIVDEYSKYAYIHKSRGDYFQEIGETGKAISEYKKAIKLDKGNPEAHLALGYIHLKKGMYKFAFNEFSESYKRINRLYDNEDKYLLLKGMADICFREVYYSYIPSKMKKKFRKDGIRYSKEALKIYSDSIKVNYILGMFNYKSPEPSDRVARDYFLKVVELNPEHVDACIALSELYYIHKNKKKSKRFARQALKADPLSKRARKLLRYIEIDNR